ncbi:hypothetical protein DPX16_19342 [Anabarilius grahami]|uniref:Uncharacterized protein n=1 Tax=Anabarilius grahami TaxID=495550 RepID=A0A3N0Z0T1_ANAGA|nr:hypothetical protein DPX16_19342 [Anabarilius grahami]
MWRAGGGEGDLCYSSKVHARVKLGPVGRSHATVVIGESEGKGAGYRGRNVKEQKQTAHRLWQEAAGSASVF